MKIKALTALTIRDAESGALTSYSMGQIASVTDTLGGQLITDGLAEEVTDATPTGTLSITENGNANVADYAVADVEVPSPNKIYYNVVGTLANPWANLEEAYDITYADLVDGIVDGVITASLWFEGSLIEGGSDIVGYLVGFNGALWMYGSDLGADTPIAFEIVWNDRTDPDAGELYHAYFSVDGTVTDLAEAVGEIPTELTVFYHPFPEGD